MSSPILYTIGHSNRTIDDFVALLKLNEIEILVDVRALPVSVHFPQFNQNELHESLEKVDVSYHWAGKQLGGIRQVLDVSPHKALKDEQLRGFADYMQSQDFDRAAVQLINLTRHATGAIFCAEQDPDFCHRSLIADYLVLQGVTVLHILEGEVKEHYLRYEARKESAELIYDHGVTVSLDLNEMP